MSRAYRAILYLKSMNAEKVNRYDDLLFVCSILHRLGSGGVDTFEQRLKSQKIQYFAQLFGVSLQYPYNLYVHGPYSPKLANDLYEIKREKIKPSSEHFVADYLEQRLAEAKKYIEGMSARQLEIVATYHWLMKVADFGVKEARTKLAKIKEVSEKELQYAINRFDEYERIKKTYKQTA